MTISVAPALPVEDQILMVKLGPAPGKSGTCIEALGRKYEPMARAPVVV